MTPNTNAASPTLLVIGPIWSSDSPSGYTPCRLTRPHVGLSPTIPHAADGNLIDPPVSVPIEAKHRPPDVAIPDPLDEAPGHRFASHGFNGTGISGWYHATANSVRLSLPISTAPAASKR